MRFAWPFVLVCVAACTATHVGDDAGAPDLALPDFGAMPPATAVAAAASADGTYAVRFDALDWTFAGSVGTPVHDVAQTTGTDAIGDYHETTFAFGTRRAAIRAYDATPVAILTDLRDAAQPNAAPFPTFTASPALPHHLAYMDSAFAPPSFDMLAPDSPWTFFDDAGRTYVLSAADRFTNAWLDPTGGALASGIDPAVTTLPAGFAHATIVVADAHLTSARTTWGHALLALSGKHVTPADGTTELAKLGYWTDNFSTYYYAYDASLGYAGTLLAVRDYFTSIGVPLGYVQLDSWWYPKGASATWNDRSGGISRYDADPTLFASGLAAFQRDLGLPLVTHARWIDAASPLRTRYAMSADTCVDPAYWDDVATRLAAAGVVTYEQDWLDQRALPRTDVLDDQPRFFDAMGDAMSAHGLHMQYCMPLPRHFLEGTRHDALVTMRVTDDGFVESKRRWFLYVSQLAADLGEWPWADVFASTEDDLLLVATLSAGIVGVGDAIGTASAANLRRAIRADGVLVKPDAPLVPIESTILADARGEGRPFVAATYTDLGGGQRAYYVYALPNGADTVARFTPAELGARDTVAIFDRLDGSVHVQSATDALSKDIGADGRGYWVVVPAPLGAIALEGDDALYVPLGRQRTDGATVRFAPGETQVVLRGWSVAAPSPTADVGAVDAPVWDATSHVFAVAVHPGAGGTAHIVWAH